MANFLLIFQTHLQFFVFFLTRSQVDVLAEIRGLETFSCVAFFQVMCQLVFIAGVFGIQRA